MIHRCKSAFGRFIRLPRRRPIVSALLFLALLVVAGGLGTYFHALRQWHRAQENVRDRHPAEALDRLAFCLRVWPRDPEVHRLAARAARQTGDFVTAEFHLNTCLRLDNGATEDVQLEFLLMRAQTGEVEEVAGLLFRYIDRGHPDAELILETIAFVYMHHFRYGPAFAALKRWIELNPQSATAYRFRGWVRERMNQPALALADYSQAIELDQGLDLIRLRLIEMYLEDKDPSKAVPHLEYLQARDADRPEVLARLGQCRFLQGKHPEARQFLESAVVKLPNDPGVLIHLARLDIQDKQPARAEERLRKLLDLDPSDTEARYLLVSALQQQRRDAEAQQELAECERHKVLLERANHLLQQEAKQPSGDPLAASEIGTLLLQIRQDRQGLYWMNEALNRDPDHRLTHQALADYYERKGDSERASFHRRRLLK